MPLSLGLLPLRAFYVRNRCINRLFLDTQRTFSSNQYKPLRSFLFKDKAPEFTEKFSAANTNNTPSTRPPSSSNSGIIDLDIPDWGNLNLPPVQRVLWPGDYQSSHSQSLSDFRAEHHISLLEGFTEKRTDLKQGIVRNFRDVDWPVFIQDAITRANFKEPTPIQSEAWPILLKGHNMVGISETGSGKTLGYALPALWHSIKQLPSPVLGPRVLIVAPVRELVAQIVEEISKYSYQTNIRTAGLFGGLANKRTQMMQLRSRPQVVVCTPGRLTDFVNASMLTLNNVSYVVLDEADRLLDMGFEDSIRSILSHVRPDRQISLFTATWPKEVRNLASEMMGNKFYRLTVGGDVSPAKSVSQHIEMCEEHEKAELLVAVLKMKAQENKGFKALVFCNRKLHSVGISNRLRKHDFAAQSFTGDMPQEARARALRDFGTGKTRVLVASDVAARGFDFKDVSLVVNHDFPRDMETYVHRIGRTGRAGAKGESISFVTWEDENRFAEIVKILKLGNQPIPPQIQRAASNRRK